jgi:hypothetical protein
MSSLLILVVLVRLVAADCECGYSSTIRDTAYVFSDILETDFLHLDDVSQDTDWQVQEYNVTAKVSRGPYGTSSQVDNVISDPLADNYSYSGPSQLGGDPGLQLYVRGGVPRDGYVPVAQVNSVREDMLWGSYRTALKLTNVRGTCGAFFWVNPSYP